MAIVIRFCGFEQGNAILELDCHHYTVVPAEDEASYSFVGSETECDRHRLGAFLDRTEAVLGTWTDVADIRRLGWVAAMYARGDAWLSEYTTREERCRTLSR